jgi:ubiquinone/menaquinone biosynthesis C-methylase UbiE
MKQKENISRAYQASKNIYDDVLTQAKLWTKLYIRLFWGVDDYEVADRVLSNITPDFSGSLLDVPVGTGVFTVRKYQSIPRAKITALDYSEDMLAQAAARFSEYDIANITCAQGDVGALPYEDASFDSVLSMNGLHAFPDKGAAVAETARVLKPGGIFCGCCYIRGKFQRSDWLIKRVLAPKGWFTPPFWTKDELAYILQRQYSDVDVQNMNAMAIFRCVK